QLGTQGEVEMIADTFMERRQLGKVLPLWVPSISLESPLTPIVEEIRQLCFDYAKRIVGRQSRTTHLPKQGPLKFGTGIRQIRAEDTCKLPSRCFRPAPHFPFRVSSSSSTYVHMRKYIYYACDIVENEVNMGRVNLVLSDDVE